MADSGTGYEMTFAEFVQLFTYPAYREKARPCIREWLGYEAKVDGERLQFELPGGGAISAERVYERVQRDAPLQRKVYNLAMSLWR